MTETIIEVVGGVDTHGDTHHAAVIDTIGRGLGSREFAATGQGYVELFEWMRGFGHLELVGVEGTGTYGVGLCRYLKGEQVRVVEIERPNRRARRQHGKSDSIDAEAAARAALAETSTASPKNRIGILESIRTIRGARQGAVKARTAAINHLKALIVASPEQLRSELRGCSTSVQVKTCAGFRPHLDQLQNETQGTKLAMRSIARRIVVLNEEVDAADNALGPLVASAAPATLELVGIGVDHAAQLLVTAGDNPERMRTDPKFARLCGTAPIPASSGKSERHRLHRGGDRQANRALHLAVVVRLRYCERTKAYCQRRTAERLSRPEIMRCLKRYAAREVFHTLRADMHALRKSLDGL
jgi:transposase